jgi:RNA polymerase sigma-70 factor (ECF subfamily)
MTMHSHALASPLVLPMRPSASEAAARPSFEALIATHRPALLGRARSLCRGHVDADDLVQDVLERAWRNYERVRDGAAARAWLFQILNNAFIDRVRAQRSAPPTDHIDDVPVAGPEPAGESPAWSQLSATDLDAAIARLPDDVRDIYRAHAFEGRDYETIARQLGMPKNTVGTRLLRARKLLRALLSPGTEGAR